MKTMSADNSDALEQRMRTQPLRQLPPGWRESLLSAARARGDHASEAFLSSRAPLAIFGHVRARLASFLWPSPVAWGAIACIWLLIGALRIAETHGGDSGIAGTALHSAQVTSFEERNRLLAELGALDRAPTVHSAPTRTAPGPRSELLHIPNYEG